MITPPGRIGAVTKDNDYASALADLEQLRTQGKVTQAQYDVHRSKLLAERSKGARPLWLRVAIFAGIILAGIVVIRLLGATNNQPNPTAAYTPRPLPTVVYELDGTAAAADITIETPTGTTQQQGVDVPLTTKGGGKGLTIRGFSPGAFVYLSAQNTGGYGSLTCRIKVDGDVVSENTATGAYAIATCKGTA